MDALPQEVRQEIVMRAAQMDGHSLTAYRFQGRESADVVKASVARHFRDAGRHVIELTRGEWNIVSARSSEGYETVQVRSTARGNEGMATAWRWTGRSVNDGAVAAAAGSLAAPDAGVAAASVGMLLNWMPPRARVIRHMTHADPGREAATLVVLADDSPGAVAARLRAQAMKSGFLIDPALAMPAQGAAWFRGGASAGDESAGEAIALRRAGEEVIATVSRHHEATAAVLHWSKPR